MMRIVGGYPQIIHPYDDEPIAVVLNGDIQDGELPYLGRFIICGVTRDGHLKGLSAGQSKWARDEFEVFPLDWEEDECE